MSKEEIEEHWPNWNCTFDRGLRLMELEPLATRMVFNPIGVMRNRALYSLNAAKLCDWPTRFFDWVGITEGRNSLGIRFSIGCGLSG